VGGLNQPLCTYNVCTEESVDDYELCQEHLREYGDELRAERMLDDRKYNFMEYPKGYDGR